MLNQRFCYFYGSTPHPVLIDSRSRKESPCPCLARYLARMLLISSFHRPSLHLCALLRITVTHYIMLFPQLSSVTRLALPQRS